MKIPQYYFTEAMLEKLTGSKEEASVEVTASVTKDEYEEVKDAMLDSKGLPAQKKKACAAKKNNLKETPEQKALKELVAKQRQLPCLCKRRSQISDLRHPHP